MNGGEIGHGRVEFLVFYNPKLEAPAMPQISPIHAICYHDRPDGDWSGFIAPPYDVIDKELKRRILTANTRNIVAIDLPHLPASSPGPKEVYRQAGETFRRWLEYGILVRRPRPGLFAYQQTFVNAAQVGASNEMPPATLRRRGLIAAVRVQPFGRQAGVAGGIHPHEQTYSGPKEDRFRLMRESKAQFSPIFGLYSDVRGQMGEVLTDVIGSGRPYYKGKTVQDQVLHELWPIEDSGLIRACCDALGGVDIFIADGHHRYTTALNYREYLIQSRGALPEEHPANFCMFTLVSMEDPGMVIWPTHRVLGGMTGWSMERLRSASGGVLKITPFSGKTLAELEAALPGAGPHAIGLYDPSWGGGPLAIAQTVDGDPLQGRFGDKSAAWRQLDVAVVQHLIIEELCQAHFCGSGGGEERITWKYPHTLEQLRIDTESPGYQVGLILQPPSLESVKQVSEAGEVMPQKSTFFYPKLATGFVIHSLE